MKWEYLYINTDTNNLQDVLNNYGETGWELVTAKFEEQVDYLPQLVKLIFKKTKDI